MKYAICNEFYGNIPFDQACAHAAKLDYTGIEIAPFTLGETATAIGSQKRTADYFYELTGLCCDLGGKVMVLGSPEQRNLINGISHQQGVAHAVEVLTGLAPTLEEHGVTIVLEPLGPEETNFMCTAESAIEIARAVDSPFVKLHLDVKAMSTEDKPIADISRDWTVHFHANDPNRCGPGMGDVEFESIFAALDVTGYDGWVSVEVFDYSPGIEALAGESIRYMQGIESAM